MDLHTSRRESASANARRWRRAAAWVDDGIRYRAVLADNSGPRCLSILKRRPTCVNPGYDLHTSRRDSAAADARRWRPWCTTFLTARPGRTFSAPRRDPLLALVSHQAAAAGPAYP